MLDGSTRLWNEHRNVKTVLNDYVKKPPFTNQLYHNRHVEDLESQLATMKTRLTDAKLAQIDMRFKNAIARGPRNWWLHGASRQCARAAEPLRRRQRL